MAEKNPQQKTSIFSRRKREPPKKSASVDVELRTSGDKQDKEKIKSSASLEPINPLSNIPSTSFDPNLPSSGPCAAGGSTVVVGPASEEIKVLESERDSSPKAGRTNENEPPPRAGRRILPSISWRFPCWNFSSRRRQSTESDAAKPKTSTIRKYLSLIRRRFSTESPSNAVLEETSAVPHSRSNLREPSMESIRELLSALPNPIFGEPSTSKPVTSPDECTEQNPKRKSLFGEYFSIFSQSRRRPTLSLSEIRRLSTGGIRTTDAVSLNRRASSSSSMYTYTFDSQTEASVPTGSRVFLLNPIPHLSSAILRYPIQPRECLRSKSYVYLGKPHISTSVDVVRFPYQPQARTSPDSYYCVRGRQPSSSSVIIRPLVPQACIDEVSPERSSNTSDYISEPQPHTFSVTTEQEPSPKPQGSSSSATQQSTLFDISDLPLESQTSTSMGTSELASDSHTSPSKAELPVESSSDLPKQSDGSSAGAGECQIDPARLGSGSYVGTSPIELPSLESKPSPDGESPEKAVCPVKLSSEIPAQTEVSAGMEGKQIDPTPLASGSKVGTPPIERPSRESKPSPDVESPKKEEKEGISEVIVPNQETTIEIVQPPGVNTGRLILGIEYAGGSDTAFQGPGVVVYKIEKSGLAASDGRIRLGDQIRKVNDTVITEDLPLNRRRYIIETLAPPKARFTIFRPDPIPFDFYEVRLTKETKSERFKMTYECHGVHERNRGVYVKKTYQDDGGFELIHPGDIFVTINNKIVISVPDIAKILSSHISVLIKFKRFKLTRPEV